MLKKYQIKYQENSKIKIIKLETSDIKNEELPLNIIEIKELKSKKITGFFVNKTISSKELNIIFYELNIMLEAKLNLNKALDILIQNRKDDRIITFLENFKSSIVNAKNLDLLFEKYKISPLIKDFWNLSLKYGNINSNIKSLNLLLEQNKIIKEQFIKAFSYPLLLLITFFFSLFIIFYFVVPNLKEVLENDTNSLPLSTKILFFLSSFFETYIFYFFAFILLLSFIFYFLYKYNMKFKYQMHKIIFYLFIKDLEFYRLFLISNLTLNNHYEFYQALKASMIFIKNVYFLEKINFILKEIQNGKTINESFEKTQIFDELCLSLPNAAQNTNSIVQSTYELKEVYKNSFDKKLRFFSFIIQPIFLFFITILLLWIILAVFVPIWDMGSNMGV